MKIKLSKLASFKLENLLLFLEAEWSVKVRNNYLKKLTSTLTVISDNPEAFPKSAVRKEIRKAVITKQSSILYLVQDDTILVVTVFDNRQNQKNVSEEIKKHFG